MSSGSEQTSGPPAKPAGGEPVASTKPWVADVFASLVVFLVALPLCIGIAVACGVPPERGLVTGIIGGIVVGLLAGAPLLVSGPAASLIVPVFDLVRTHGIEALAPVVILAGVWQAIAGILRLGQWFRAVAPAVIHGMLIGIGILICASQLHVAMDSEPEASFLTNVLTIPAVLNRHLGPRPEGGGAAPILISVATIGLLVAWNRYRPKRLTLVPGHLVALSTVSLATFVFAPAVQFLDISPEFLGGLAPVTLADFQRLRNPSFVGLSLVFAFVASAATLLTANAIDQRQTHSRADYDREMRAQGIGNILTGAMGGLPMTGVIVRSSVNVDAGARTRLSTILHGVWILGFVSVAPEILETIPRASLGAILVYTGYRLIDFRVLIALYRQGRAELAICLITLFGVMFVSLLAGILAGLAAAIGKLVYTLSHLEIRSEPSLSENVHHLHLTGSATFLQLPRLASRLEEVSPDRELHVHIDRLDHIDHACLELLSNWNRRRETEGAPGMVVEWDELTDRYRQAFFGIGTRDHAPSRSLLSLVWDEWKRLYGLRGRQGQALALSQDWKNWIDSSRIRLQLAATTFDDVLVVASELLAPAAERSPASISRALRDRVEGHVTLGEGVSLPHAPIAGLDRSIAALVTTERPVEVAGEPADLFFVLLAPQDDPQQHLRSLAHVGRLCHDSSLLAELRLVSRPDEATLLMERANQSMLDAETSTVIRGHRMLAVLELESDSHAERIAQLVGEAFLLPLKISSDDGRLFDVLRRVLKIPVSRRLLLLPIEDHDLDILRQLIAEYSRLLTKTPCRLHALRPDLS